MEIHAKGMCITCYKKLHWSQKEGVCKRCGRMIKIHAKGLCPGCYNFIFHLDKAKAQNYRKKFGLDYESYKNKTKQCVICGFDKIVELHHLDGNNQNNSSENLIGLCPNHHKMIHIFEYRKEIIEKLQNKGFKAPKDPKLDFKVD